jgi:two-component system, chemotaxis family, CheB/CheR fusion protein
MPAKRIKRLPAAQSPRSDDGALQEYARSIFPIVGVGASAGGIEAASTLLQSLPERPGLAVVIIQHQERKRAGGLPQVFSRVTSLPVTEARDGAEVLADHVYISPPFADVTISGGVLHLGMPETRAALPIDLFLESLAEDQGSRAIGVVLSGTASDGTHGAKAIKAEGGITFAQDESARFDGMPRAAIAAGSIDFVLSPDKIAKELVRIAHHAYVAGGADGAGGRLATADLTKVFTLLNVSHDVDFTHYKPATLERRVRRRMVLHRAETVNEYLDYIRENPNELELLYSDMLIRVTGFFRDLDVFEMLKSEIIPELLARRESNAPLRVWVPGCATGEEVYSLAIAFLEIAGECPVQIFGTDISETVIDRARAGIYPDSAVTDVAAERLHRFFTRVDGGVRVAQAVRDCCIFARQDLTKDPPFSKLDMISCRNVLIYLGAVLQRRIMSNFHYALRTDGFLLLGSSEAMNAYGDLFGVVGRRFKLYRKRPVVNQRLAAAASFVTRAPRAQHAAANLVDAEAVTATGVLREADRVLLARFCPPGVVINENLEIVQFRGRTSPYLEPAPGTATFNLLKMAREGLLAEVHTAVNTARRKEIPVRRGGVRVKTNDHTIVIDLEVIPFIAGGSDRYYAIVFEPAPLPLSGRPSKAKAKIGTSEEKQDLSRLRRELEATRDYLQSIIEEQEAMNEELRFANEEIQSSNEELQSTNEELETAKEELQSSNEELITLNDELENRNDELALVNSDLNNLLTSIEIGVVILDGGMRIRRANTAAQRLLGLLPTDVGRPIGDMKTTLVLDHLDQTISSVIENLEVRETTVQDRNGRWYSLRIRPYMTMDNKIDGAVLVLIDVDQLRRLAPLPTPEVSS